MMPNVYKQNRWAYLLKNRVCRSITVFMQNFFFFSVLADKQSKKTGKNPDNKTDHQKKIERELNERRLQLDTDKTELIRQKEVTCI